MKSGSGPKPADAKPGVPVPPVAGATGESAEGRRLVAKAWELLNKPDLSRTELDAADALCQRAIALDPSDADALAAGAQVDTWYIYYNFDGSASRLEGARDKSMRALHLAPRSFEARLAQANYWVRGFRSLSAAAAKDAESVLLELAQERPDEPRTLYTLAMFRFYRHPSNPDLATLARLERNPAFAVAATKETGWECFWAGRYAEADRAADRSIALLPYWDNLGLKIELALHWHGDLDLAKKTLDRLPPANLQEDVGVALAFRVHQWRAEPLESLAALEAMPKDWLRSQGLDGPRSFYLGQARLQAKQTEAAQGDFRRALDLLGKRLADDPNNAWYLGLKAEALHFLGEHAEAAKTYRLFREVGDARVWSGSELWTNLVMLFEPPAIALDYLQGQIQRGPTESLDWPLTAASLRLDPRFDPIRHDPGFARLLTQVEADPRKSPHASSLAAPNAPVTDAKSVAVLAFANLSEDKGNEYFSDGITEELLNVLAKVPGLKVSARTSAFYFKGKEVPIPEIAQKLGVAYVVEGSVRKSGDKVRITAQLIKAAGGFHVWSDTFTRDLKDIFAVQDEIAGLIAQQLQLKLDDSPRRERVVNPEAHQLYLEGKYFLNQFSYETASKAVGLLERAVQLDPQFAPAWAALSRAGSVQGGYANTRPDFEAGYRLAREAANRALTLDPNLADAYLARVEVQAGSDFDWKGARESLRHAQELAPTDAAVLDSSARMAYYFGTKEKAVDFGAQAVALDPVNPSVRNDYGFALTSLRRFKEADAEYRRLIELNPKAPWGHAGASFNLTAEGRFDEAAAEAAQENNEWSKLYALCLAQWGQQKRAEADTTTAQLIKAYADVAAFQIAEVYAFRRDNDHAFEWLERAYRQRDSGLAWSRSSIFLENLYADPRWDGFLRKLGLADDQLK